MHPYGSVPKGCAWFPISTAEKGNEVTFWLQLLLLVLLLGCSDPPAPPPSSQSGASSARPVPDSSGAPSAVEPPPQSSTGILALGHARAFETYDWTHIGEDQYYHKQTLGLVTLSAPADDAMMSCRTFDYAGSSQVVCAVHGDLPGAPLSFATLPANLVPASEAGRETALDLLCIDIKLRASSQRRIWAFGPDARGQIPGEIDRTESHVFVTLSEVVPKVRPIASRPWPTPCSPIWERPAYRPDLSRLSSDDWLLVWDRET